MPDANTSLVSSIQWPDGIDEQLFLDQYWQKKPLLIRRAFPDFETPLPADELAGLSMDADTSGRIITRDENGAYHLEHGPFEEERFSTLTGNQWSLLVTDVEKHIPEFAAYLHPFRFIPDWRIDDLMISYAPDGASVGAHIDEYDVFLLQGSGVRTWRIDARSNETEHQMRQDGDLKILADFNPTDTWDLNAGDMLYLPPNIAHHGTAKGDDCTTWSVGFRSPRLPEFVTRIAELASEQLSAQRYTDDRLTPARHGEISHACIMRFKTIWMQATQMNDSQFANLLGRWLTESTADSVHDDQICVAPESSENSSEYLLAKSPFSRFAWISEREDESVTLFVDGSGYPCSSSLAQIICASSQYIKLSCTDLDTADTITLQVLMETGSLTSVED